MPEFFDCDKILIKFANIFKQNTFKILNLFKSKTCLFLYNTSESFVGSCKPNPDL